MNGVNMQVFVKRDAVLRDIVPPSYGSDSEQEQGEPDVPPEDEKFFDTPDADAMEEVIGEFVGLEQQERRGFTPILLQPLKS